MNLTSPGDVRYTSPEELRAEGRWWNRERISTVSVVEAPDPAAGGGSVSRVRRTPWQRHWLLGGSVLGLAACLVSARGAARLHLRLLCDMIGLCSYGAVFAVVFSADYRGQGYGWLGLSDDDAARWRNSALVGFVSAAALRQLQAWRRRLPWDLGGVACGCILPALLGFLSWQATQLQRALLRA